MRAQRATLALSVAFASLPVWAGEEPPLRGYSAESSRAQREREAKLRAIPTTDNLREYMRRLSARPHHLGSPYGREVAEWIRARFVARLEEPALAVDPTSGQRSEQLPTYNAYSIDGDVTGPLVYVNYGLPADYERLERLGVSVKGAIVIARYGNSWRGIKPKMAAERGAAGCLIYSDPRDDGYFQGDVFPLGAWRPKDGVQRGSVLDMPLYPGDPLTPGVGATEATPRLAIQDSKSLTKIPVLPISYGDAQPLLAALKGPMAPEEWRGALPIPYHIGPGPAKVHLKLKFNWDRKPIHDVIGTIPGATEADEWIVRGNHHDPWLNGAEDPISGLAPLLEEARALGELLKQGWRPRRTIIYAAWDGEEPMLLGSTEWAEANAEELTRHAAVYINTDGNGRGFLNVEGSHSLEAFVNGVAREIEDPETRLTVWKRARLAAIANASAPEARQEARTRADLRIGALGSGSDFTAFLDHLGIATLNLGYGGEDGGGIYHSIYDDFYWYTHFSDTDFFYGRALAQTVGTAVLRLAGAEVLPFDFTQLADTAKKYLGELRQLVADKQEEVRERNRQIEEGFFGATRDPRKPFVPPPAEDVPPHLNFAPLENAVEALSRSADRFERAMGQGGASLPAEKARSLNARLREAERTLTSPDGLPGRPWYRHLLYAPGFYTGYAAKTMPSVREAIEQKRWRAAEGEIIRVAKALEAEAALVDSAAKEME